MSKINIVKDFIPISNAVARSRYGMKPYYITIHNTGDSRNGTDTKMNTEYIDCAKGYVSCHFTVDDKKIYQELPCNEIGWHAGDGEGEGNMKSIGIEICENNGIDWIAARSNGIELIIFLMDTYNIPIENVVPHQRWSGKYCPRKILDEGWDKFINDIIVAKYKPSVGAEEVIKWAIGNGVSDCTRLKENCTKEEILRMLYSVYKNIYK